MIRFISDKDIHRNHIHIKIHKNKIETILTGEYITIEQLEQALKKIKEIEQNERTTSNELCTTIPSDSKSGKL